MSFSSVDSVSTAKYAAMAEKRVSVLGFNIYSQAWELSRWIGRGSNRDRLPLAAFQAAYGVVAANCNYWSVYCEQPKNNRSKRAYANAISFGLNALASA